MFWRLSRTSVFCDNHFDDQYTDLSLTHPLIRKVNGVFSLLGESKKGDQQGDVALTNNDITEQTSSIPNIKNISDMNLQWEAVYDTFIVLKKQSHQKVIKKQLWRIFKQLKNTQKL